MLAIQVIRERTDEVRRALADRHSDAPLDAVLAADERRRALLIEVEAARKAKNDASKAIGATKCAASVAGTVDDTQFGRQSPAAKRPPA